jgi:hypothetical protein
MIDWLSAHTYEEPLAFAAILAAGMVLLIIWGLSHAASLLAGARHLSTLRRRTDGAALPDSRPGCRGRVGDEFAFAHLHHG